MQWVMFGSAPDEEPRQSEVPSLPQKVLLQQQPYHHIIVYVLHDAILGGTQKTRLPLSLM